MITILILVLFPIIYTFLASFKSNAEILVNPGRVFPEHFTLENYKIAWNSEDFDVKRLVWNSTYYTAICVCMGILKSSMAGYVFARAEFPGRKIMFAAF